jgi:hypothetical protein
MQRDAGGGPVLEDGDVVRFADERFQGCGRQDSIAQIQPATSGFDVDHDVPLRLAPAAGAIRTPDRVAPPQEQVL